jgi:hypothetical protein
VQAVRLDDIEPGGHGAVDVSVEFAHIYADEAFGDEQIAGARELLRQARRMAVTGQTYSLAVLIDDYNPAVNTLDTSDFVRSLAAHGAAPDHVVLESSIAPIAQEFLRSVSRRERRSLERHAESRGRMPCALLLAAWHLIRLGAPVSAPVAAAGWPPAGDESLTILPARFAPVEDRALEIIDASPYRDFATRVRHSFF